MRHVGDDLQGIRCPPTSSLWELDLHARLVDGVLRRAAAEDDRRGPRPGIPIRRLDDVADDVDGRRKLLSDGLREAHPDRRIGDGEKKIGTFAVGRRENAVTPRRRPQMPAEEVENPRGVRAQLERRRELGDPVVVRADSSSLA